MSLSLDLLRSALDTVAREFPDVPIVVYGTVAEAAEDDVEDAPRKARDPHPSELAAS